ncbi:hypothetical protein ACRRTK_017772 [Alexandromys fortis]
MPQKSWVEGRRRLAEGGARRAGAPVRFPRAAAANAAHAAAARAGSLPRYRRSPGRRPPLGRPPAAAPPGTRAREEATLGSRRLPRSPAGAARLPQPVRPPPARAHTRASHTAAPRTAPPRTPRSAPPAAARACCAPPQSAPRPPRPISFPPGATVPGSASPLLQPGGAEGRTRGWAGAWLGRLGESRQETPSLAPGRLPDALGAGRCRRWARGSGRGAAPAPGGSPTRGSCCLNAGALPSRRLPRPAQPRPPGAPVPFVPGRCSLPRERRDWSARTEPPSRTRSAAARLTAEAPGRVNQGTCPEKSTDRRASGPEGAQERFLPLEVLPFTVLPTIHSAALTLCRVSSLEGFSNQDHSGLAVCRRYSGCPLLGALEGHQVEAFRGSVEPCWVASEKQSFGPASVKGHQHLRSVPLGISTMMGLELTVIPSGSTPACLALVPPSVGSRDVSHLLVLRDPPAYCYLGMRHMFPSEPQHKLPPFTGPILDAEDKGEMLSTPGSRDLPIGAGCPQRRSWNLTRTVYVVVLLALEDDKVMSQYDPIKGDVSLS